MGRAFFVPDEALAVAFQAFRFLALAAPHERGIEDVVIIARVPMAFRFDGFNCFSALTLMLAVIVAPIAVAAFAAVAVIMEALAIEF